MMKNWKKPVVAVISAGQVTEVIKTYAWTCINGFERRP